MTNYNKYSTNNLEKYHIPVINENIVCDDCINFNFNDISDFGCQSNQKNNKIIVFTTIKIILNVHIEEKNNINKKSEKISDNKTSQVNLHYLNQVV